MHVELPGNILLLCLCSFFISGESSKGFNLQFGSINMNMNGLPVCCVPYLLQLASRGSNFFSFWFFSDLSF